MESFSKKELAEFLWLEINKAILNSTSVKNCLKILERMDMIDFLSEHDYVLDGRKLVEKILDQQVDGDTAKAENTFITEDTSSDLKKPAGDITKRVLDEYQFSLN